MKQFQVQQSHREILCENHPYCLQSKCLLRALDAQVNMLFTYLGWKTENKKIFNPVFEKIILKPLNRDVESRNKLLVSTACATVYLMNKSKTCCLCCFFEDTFLFL